MITGIELAITVDDLPVHGPTVQGYSRSRILKFFLSAFEEKKIYGVVGFLNGIFVNSDNSIYRLLLIKWVKSQQVLGNHTFSHIDIRTVDAERYIADIYENEEIIEKIYQEKYVRYFRYPFFLEGETEEKREKIKHYLNNSNYIIVPCTVDILDFLWNEPVSLSLRLKDYDTLSKLRLLFLKTAQEKLIGSIEVSRAIFKRDIRHILCLHCGIATSIFMIDLLNLYQNLGCHFITTQKAMEDDVYQNRFNFDVSNESNFLSQAYKQFNIKMNEYVYPTVPRVELDSITNYLKEKVYA